MRERPRDVGWIGVLAGMAGVVVLVLAILLALGARIARGPNQPDPGTVSQAAPSDVPETEIKAIEGTPTPNAAQQSSSLADRLRDGEIVWVEFISGLSLAGTVQIENGLLAILNPLGEVIDLGEVAALVKEDGQTLLPAEFGIEAKASAPVPTLAVSAAVTTAVTTVVSAEVSAAAQVEPLESITDTGAPVVAQTVPDIVPDAVPDGAVVQVQVAGLGNDLAVSEILDQHPDGTIFRATLQSGEEVLAMKQNPLKLVRVDASGSATGKTIVPLWMIVSLQPVS